MGDSRVNVRAGGGDGTGKRRSGEPGRGAFAPRSGRRFKLSTRVHVSTRFVRRPARSQPEPGRCVPGWGEVRRIRARGLSPQQRYAGLRKTTARGARGRTNGSPYKKQFAGSPGRSRGGVGVHADGRGADRIESLRKRSDAGASSTASVTNVGRFVRPARRRLPPASMRAGNVGPSLHAGSGPVMTERSLRQRVTGTNRRVPCSHRGGRGVDRTSGPARWLAGGWPGSARG